MELYYIANNYLLWFILAVIMSAMPMPLIKKYLTTNNIFYLLVCGFIYIILTYGYVQILKNHTISKMYPLLKILSIILVFFIGVFFFNDELKLKNIIGIIMGIVAIYLLCG